MESAVRNNEAAGRFEIESEGHIAELTYRLKPGSITFIHTGVPAELEGRGLARQLAVAGLEYAKANQLAVIPLCPYVAAYIKRHPEYRELVPEEHRPRVS